MAKKTLSVITKQTGTPLEIAVISRRLSTPVIVPPTQLTINYLRNLYDVSIVNAVDMQVLQYESGSSYWVNTSPVDAHTYFYTKDQVDALIVDVSGAIIAGNFIKEGSLGTDFVWNAGLLDVSIVTMDYAYVNASLNALSNSVAATYATNASVNTALGAYATNASVNTALGAYATNASVNLALEAYSTALTELDDVSIVSIADEQVILYDSSDAIWKNVDTINIDDIIYTKAQIDASFATIAYVDSKAVDSYGGYYVQDNSIAAVIPAGTTYTKITSIWNKTSPIHQKDVSVDTSIGTLTINKTGKFLVNGSFSFSSGTPNVVWKGAAFYDNAEKGWIHWKVKNSTAADAVSASFTGLLDVSIVGKALDFRVRHDQAGNVNFALEYGNMNVIKVG